jgi:5'-3' exonuclease
LNVYLIDGTYELFRHYYALPPAVDENGLDIAAVRGVLASVLGMINNGASHLAVATDHVIESLRNGLWSGYKAGEGIEAALRAQFSLLEEVLSAAGVLVWPMVEFEADDALATAAAAAASDSRVDQVVICTPDKDLAQCVTVTRIVQLNRRMRVTLDEPAVIKKFGVPPVSIPDYLALVGDAADGYPGLGGWGAKSAAAVLANYEHLEFIPADFCQWNVNAANAGALANIHSQERDLATLFRNLVHCFINTLTYCWGLNTVLCCVIVTSGAFSTEQVRTRYACRPPSWSSSKGVPASIRYRIFRFSAPK